MNTVGVIPPSSGFALEPQGGANRAETQEAAEQFEALLIGQMLKEAAPRSAGIADDSDSSSESMLEVGYEQLSKALAAGGGLGIARLIGNQLAGGISKNPPPRGDR
jgi:Rod binding domain-containing protein